MAAPAFRWDWAAAVDAVTPSTRAIVVNSPHNPSGSCFTADDLAQLAALACRHGLWVISDEVYAGIIHDGRRHLSCASRPDLRARSFVCLSFGKTFHCTGWKVGACLAPPPLTCELRKVHQFTTFSVNTPAQAALADLCADAGRRRLGTLFQERRDLLLHNLAGTALRALPPAQGSYFQLCDYSALSTLNDLEFARWLTIQHGVATIPLSPLYHRPPPGQRLVRLCFAKQPATLLAAARRLPRM
jgi:methionine aminotransferase